MKSKNEKQNGKDSLEIYFFDEMKKMKIEKKNLIKKILQVLFFLW